MKNWLVGMLNKDWSKLPVIVAIAAPVLFIASIFAMGGMTKAIIDLGLGEVVPVWALQVAVMTPFVGFVGILVLAIIACVALILLDISVNKNFDEYRELMNPVSLWTRKDNNSELSNEIFGSAN